MAKLHFELVSPEKLLFSGEVDQVDVPGNEGDFGVLADHAPLIAMLRPGVVTVHNGGSRQSLVVFGGFAEVSPKGLTILADVAAAMEDFDIETLKAQIQELEENIAKLRAASEPNALDREIERLDHFRTVEQHLSSTAMH
ncbi:MAG: F0F1 ATP synthase subunit epsilon [Pseudorhodoplanes sp.]